MSTELLDVGTILFEAALFFIFCYFLWYLIKTRILPVLHSGMEEAKKYLTQLQKKKQLLLTQHENLEKKMEAQDLKLCVLDQKMQKWHTQLIHEEQMKHEQQKLQRKQLLAKKQKQIKNFSLLKMQQIVIPQAVALSLDELATKVDDEKKKKLLANVIDAL